MKEIYLLRHAEKDGNGLLTQAGEDEAKLLAKALPRFSSVFTSGSSRTIATAKLLSNTHSTPDIRAAYATAPQAESDAINKLASDKGLTFLEAAHEFGDIDVLEGIEMAARRLDGMIKEILDIGDNRQRSLIVSHDLSISPAMALRGVPLASIDFLDGFIISHNGQVQPFTHKDLIL